MLSRFGTKHRNLNLTVGLEANASAVRCDPYQIEALGFSSHRAGGDKCGARQRLTAKRRADRGIGKGDGKTVQIEAVKIGIEAALGEAAIALKHHAAGDVALR